MGTLEDIYASLMQEHEDAQAAHSTAVDGELLPEDGTTLEALYAHRMAEHEAVSAANPYGCNQYGHRKGHQGSSSSKEENEIDKYWKLPTINERKEQFEKWRNEARQAKKALDDFTRLTYRPAYVKTHGMDQEPNQEDWRTFENADNERRRLEYEANQAEKKFEERKNKIANYWKNKRDNILVEDLIKLKNEEREKSAKSVELNRTIERLKKQAYEAQQEAIARPYTKEKNHLKKIRDALQTAQQKQKELYARLRYLRDLFS